MYRDSQTSIVTGVLCIAMGGLSITTVRSLLRREGSVSRQSDLYRDRRALYRDSHASIAMRGFCIAMRRLSIVTVGPLS